MIRMSSSLRAIPLKETLKNAINIANKLGVSRVTDTTYLDRIGLPVYASIRPTSQSLCVNAGKGLRKEEAKVGAYMEAIEFAMAEYGNSSVKAVMLSVRHVLDGKDNPDSILDLCPRWKESIDLNASMWGVEAEDIITTTKYMVPAELVFHPAGDLSSGKFGSNTNGLCSGNTLEEASLHGLCETIERDTSSFHRVNDDSILVAIASLPTILDDSINAIKEAGLDIIVRYSEGQLGIPYFITMISEKDKDDPNYMNGGYGCHPIKEIALMRSFCEAAQSRLTHIHGSRDDMLETFEMYEQWTEVERKDYCKKLFSKMTNADATIKFDEINDYGESIQNIADAFEVLVKAVYDIGLRKILRVVYTGADDLIHVVRIIVPGLENFNTSNLRVGPRLRDYVENSND